LAVVKGVSAPVAVLVGKVEEKFPSPDNQRLFPPIGKEKQFLLA